MENDWNIKCPHLYRYILSFLLNQLDFCNIIFSFKIEHILNHTNVKILCIGYCIPCFRLFVYLIQQNKFLHKSTLTRKYTWYKLQSRFHFKRELIYWRGKKSLTQETLQYQGNILWSCKIFPGLFPRNRSGKNSSSVVISLIF